MAKRRRNTKKKHQGAGEAQEEFMAQVEETNTDSEQWSESDPQEEPSYQNGLHADHADHIEDQHEPIQQEPMMQPSSLNSIDEALEEAERYEEENGAQATEVDEAPISDEGFSLGNYLRSEREAKGISLKNVSQSTKISTTNLEYLESDDLASLPDRAYVMGYVKSYARLLGANTDFCLNLLEKTYASLGETQREPEIVIPQAQNSPTIETQLPVVKIAAAAAMVLVVIGVGYFFLGRDKSPEDSTVAETQEKVEVNNSIQPQTLSAETPLQEDLPDQPVGEATPVAEMPKEEVKPVEVKKEEPKVVEIKKEEPKVVETKKEEPKVIETKKKEPKVVETKKEEPKVVEAKKEETKKEEPKRNFYPLVMPLYTTDGAMSEEKQQELLPSQFRVSPQSGVQSVFITASKGDSWLTYKKDGDPVKKFVLKKGRSILFRAKEARVFLGNLGAVNIFLDNKPLKVTSTSGVKSLVFPQTVAKKYVTPLFIYKPNGSVQPSDEWIDENQP